MAKMKKLKVFEGFAGYGGASFALRRIKELMVRVGQLKIITK